MASNEDGRDDASLREDSVPLPPADAEVFTTGCDYCIAGCGYKVFRWPVGKQGRREASDNALGIDFPVASLSGRWISPNMHNVVSANGAKHHVVVLPDPEMEHVNKGGDHSIRGGCIARKCYNPEAPTRDRLQYPQLRVNGKLERISWDDAVAIMAGVSKHVIENHGVHAWACKASANGYWENTYAISKLALRSVKTPAFSSHDRPGPAGAASGLRDSGIDEFSASYDDWGEADVLFVSGTDPYETKTMIWNEFIKPAIDQRGQKVIFALPRATTGVAYAEKHGGLWLDLFPGTDTPLQVAIIRLILEKGWADRDFLATWVGDGREARPRFGHATRHTPGPSRTLSSRFAARGIADYQQWVLAQDWATLPTASRITGVSQEKIRRAAELLARPIDGRRPRASFGLEKGSSSSNDYTNTTSLAALGLICGAGNRPGRVISRFGGHQLGDFAAEGFLRTSDTAERPGSHNRPADLDRWVMEDKARFAWVIGTSWIQAMAGSVGLDAAVRRRTSESPHQVSSTNVEKAIGALTARADAGGMVVVDSDVYPVEPLGSDYADIVLPASGWGENDFTRANGERRMRVYSKFYDAPGEARPDWWAVAQFAKAMGYEGYDWKDGNDVFEESALHVRGSRTDYYPLVWLARKKGMRAHDLLRQYGSNGIQGPLRYENGELSGTRRLHDSTATISAPEGPTVVRRSHYAFDSPTGKATLFESPWSLFEDFFEFIEPRGEELWVTNGRINERWQSGFGDGRRSPMRERWPANFIEIHPSDAARRGIESGDRVAVWSRRVPVQLGNGLAVEGADVSFTGLRRAGLIELAEARVEAVAIVSDAVKEGVSFMSFAEKDAAANSLVPRVPDPVTNRHRFKLGVGFVDKVGGSDGEHDLAKMSFAPRNIA